MLQHLNLVRLPGPTVRCPGCGRPLPVVLAGLGPPRCPKCWAPAPADRN